MAVVELGVHAQAHARRARQLCGDVALEDVFLGVDVGVELRFRGAAHDAVFVVDRGVEEIGDLRSAAPGVDVETLVPGHVLEQHLVPVVVGKDVGVEAPARPFDLLLGVIGFEIAALGKGRSGPERFVESLHVGHAVGDLLHACRHRDARFGPDVDRQFLGVAALLGGDDQHAVGAPAAVERRRRGVFKHRERLDRLGGRVVEHLGHDLHAVDDDQRLLVRAEGRDAANPEVRAVGSGFARRLHGDHARNASGEGRRQVARSDLQFRGLHGLHGADEALLLLDAEAYDHYFADAVFGFEELNQLEEDRVVGRDAAGLVAQEAERHLVRSRGNVDRVVAVGTGDGAGVRTLDIDAGPDDRPVVGRRNDIAAEGLLGGHRGGGFGRSRGQGAHGDLPSPDFIGQSRFFQ